MGVGTAMWVIDQIAMKGVFRVKDLNASRLSHNWLRTAHFLGHAVPQGKGVWSHPKYRPTRYELVQVRFPKSVFWGPSALWLQGELIYEPPQFWLAISNKGRIPRTIERDSMVILRTRRLETNVVTLLPEFTAIPLRVHTVERARADIIARMRPPPSRPAGQEPPAR